MMTVDEFIASVLNDAEGRIVRSIHSPGRSTCLHLLSEIEDRLEAQHKLVIRNFPEVTRVAEDRTFKNHGREWVTGIKDRVRSETKKNDHVWLLLTPKDPEPSPALDCVPISYWFIVWNSFYRYLPRNLVRPYGIDNRYAHVIIADPFYLNSYKHKDDFWCKGDLEYIQDGFAWPEVIEQDALIYDTKVSSLAEDLREHYGMDIYPAYARALLIKEHFGMAGQGGRTDIHFHYLEKRGDMLLVNIETDPHHAPLWCKFGSPRMLHLEHLNASRLRREPDLRPFLYITKNNPLRDALRADYIGLLVSEHETAQSQQPQTLESFYDYHAKKMKSMTPSVKIAKLLARLEEFFGILHRPARWAQRTTKRFDLLLTSRRAKWPDGEESPLQRARPGAYQIESIRPRDGGRPERNIGEKGVMIYLNPKGSSARQVLVSWASPQWRWKLWRYGLVECTPVDLRESVTISPAGDRIARHLTNYRDAVHVGGAEGDLEERFRRLLKGLEMYLDVTIKTVGDKEDGEVMLEGDCNVREDELMSLDLYGRYLHGDLHPRNVLVFEPGPKEPAKGHKQKSGVTGPDIKIIDVAQAVVDEDEHAPMAYDFVVLEADAKARMILDVHFQAALEIRDPDVDRQLLTELDQEEGGLWNWCQINMANCFDDSWKTNEDKTRLTRMPGGRFGFVAAWRCMSLSRLRRCAVDAEKLPQHRIEEINWTPARSYAQALFLASIGYLKLLDPEKDKMRGYTCIVGASHALDVLQEAKKP